MLLEKKSLGSCTHRSRDSSQIMLCSTDSTQVSFLLNYSIPGTLWLITCAE